MSHTRTTACLLLALLLAVPALAENAHTNQDSVLPGFDYWQTVGSGATKYNFANDPLPLDFFCNGSGEFKGELTFEGVPLVTSPSRALGTTDTIVERLGTAKFDERGFATTQIQVRALRLTSRETITNKCGEFAVSASLVGQQPTTQIAFQQSTLCPDTGVFTANLDLNVAMTFTNVSTGESISVNRLVSLPTFTDEPYTVGAIATACPQSAFTASQTATVLNGTDVSFTVVGSSQVVATGCWCNCDGTQCLPILPEHEGPDEDHFIMTPCEFFGGEYCTDPEVILDIRAQVEELYNAGVITEPVDVATDKLVNKQY